MHVDIETLGGVKVRREGSDGEGEEEGEEEGEGGSIPLFQTFTYLYINKHYMNDNCTILFHVYRFAHITNVFEDTSEEISPLHAAFEPPPINQVR